MHSASKQKVVHLTSVHTPSDTRIAYRECATLAEAGYEVVLVAAGSVKALPPGVGYHGVPAPRNRFERMTRTVWHVFRAALVERADVYHFHDPELMGVGLALRALGARVVFDVHEDIPHDIVDKPWIPAMLRKPISAASVMALRSMHRWYSAIVAATPAIARRFPHRRTVVVCNYPRIDELPVSAAKTFPERERAAIYLGSITQLRCIDLLIRAMTSRALAADVRLILAGTFEDETLERRMRSASGWERVEFTGFCPRADVPATLGRARVGMLLFRPAANHDEAMPTKLFEYLGAGLPVIISDTLQCSSIVREHECGLVVDPFDTDAIARAMSFLIENPATAQAMGERGRRLVTERYQWTSEATKLKKLYAEIA
jgi:glycosyltransferase involved in cell wall biosynthesis